MSMKKRVLLGAFLAATAFAGSAGAVEVVIFHGWSSPAEVAALNVLETALAAKGDTWKDLAIPHDSGSNVNIVNMVTGGNPPDVFMEANPDLYRDLESQGLGFDLGPIFDRVGATANFPQVVKDTIAVDGKVVKAPVAIHIDGMLFYNKAVSEKAGVDPTKWQTLDEMFAELDKAKAAGVIPLAIGAQEWSTGYLFHALYAALNGKEAFEKIYGTEPDKAAINSPEMKAALAMLRKFQQAADPASPNRAWNDTTNLVITAQALMQIHGDWMKGEWKAAGKTAGVDFGCIAIPGTKAAVVTVDAWGLLGGRDDTKKAGQEHFAELVVDPQVQSDFAAAKGSTPVVLNAPTDKLDECNQNALAILQDASKQVPTPHNTADADWRASLWQILFKFWSDPAMTEDAAIAEMETAYDSIF
jgi:glucose/mannose transport system substrate-binding protein